MPGENNALQTWVGLLLTSRESPDTKYLQDSSVWRGGGLLAGQVKLADTALSTTWPWKTPVAEYRRETQQQLLK